MGAYSEEELRKYATDEIEVKVEYFYDRNDSVGSDDGQTMILQTFQMYRNGELVVFRYTNWGWPYWSSSGPFDEKMMGEIGGLPYTTVREEGITNKDILLEKVR